MESLDSKQQEKFAKKLKVDESAVNDPMSEMPKPKFSQQILKSVVGDERANKVLQSMSMNVIPKVSGGSMTQLSEQLQSSKSTNNMGNVFKSQLEIIQKNLEKKTKKRGISQYMDDNDDDDDNSEFSDDEFDQNDNKDMSGEKDPAKLIDLELVNLLKFCNDLKNKHKETDDHQEAVMMNSIELGKKTKEKTLVLDMDECMIAAKFEGKQQKNFQANFSFDFQGTQIHVRLRPYLADALEKLSQLYEIVVWTAGVQEYADVILDKIDPEKTIFKKRMYRQSCVKTDQFFIKDLDVILDREKTSMVIVDNSILSFAFDLPNGVPINSFMGDEQDDKDLLYLISFLEEAFYQKDIRTACEESFKLQYLLSTITNK